jgi:hypothetical protein
MVRSRGGPRHGCDQCRPFRLKRGQKSRALDVGRRRTPARVGLILRSCASAATAVLPAARPALRMFDRLRRWDVRSVATRICYPDLHRYRRSGPLLSSVGAATARRRASSSSSSSKSVGPSGSTRVGCATSVEGSVSDVRSAATRNEARHQAPDLGRALPPHRLLPPRLAFARRWNGHVAHVAPACVDLISRSCASAAAVGCRRCDRCDPDLDLGLPASPDLCGPSSSFPPVWQFARRGDALLAEDAADHVGVERELPCNRADRPVLAVVQSQHIGVDLARVHGRPPVLRHPCADRVPTALRRAPRPDAHEARTPPARRAGNCSARRTQLVDENFVACIVVLVGQVIPADAWLAAPSPLIEPAAAPPLLSPMS